MRTIVVGLDLAKQAFSTCSVDLHGHVLARKELRRAALASFLAQLPAGTVVAMEACSGAHEWVRMCLRHGLQPRLMAAQFVKPYRKGQAAKNDRNDAEAIATAARQGNMRFVPVKTEAQQTRLAWHRAREGYKHELIAVSNRIRGLLAEFGIVVARGSGAWMRLLGDADQRERLPAMLRDVLDDQAAHWRLLQERMAQYDRQIAAHGQHDMRCRRVQKMAGIGPITADAMVASIGDGREFRHGRQLSAWLGLVPSQHSTGGRAKLGKISCHGDKYLRTLLVQGARSCLTVAMRVSVEKATPEQRWIRDLAARMSFGKTVVAIANKHARQMWAILAHDQDYDAHAAEHVRMTP